VASALERARAARVGESCARWRIGQESKALGASLTSLKPLGLDRGMPAWPDWKEMHDVLMSALTPGDLRAAVVTRWGTDALTLGAECYRTGRSGEVVGASIPLEELCAMAPEEFSALKRELESIDRNFAKPAAPPEEDPENAKHIARIAARGLTLADLQPIDRERFVIETGARVVAVAPGSAAERAGLRPGDVIWLATVPWKTKAGVKVEPVVVEDAVNFGYLLGCAEEAEQETVVVAVVRDEGVVKLEMGK